MALSSSLGYPCVKEKTEIFLAIIKAFYTVCIACVSPSDGDFVIGPCRLQRPGMTAGNRQQQAREPGT